MGTDFPVLAVTMLQEFCEQQGFSIGLLFVDARQAFYAFIRSLVVPVEESDPTVA